jgi:hypothetical protein
MCTSSILKPIQKLGRGLLGISKPKAPAVSQESKDAAAERKAQMVQQEEAQKEERQKRLETQIRRKKRGGSGQRSLISGQAGGVGYFDESI